MPSPMAPTTKVLVDGSLHRQTDQGGKHGGSMGSTAASHENECWFEPLYQLRYVTSAQSVSNLKRLPVNVSDGQRNISHPQKSCIQPIFS